MPAGQGDPHMEAMDGVSFDFVGLPHRLHKLYARGPVRLLARMTPVGWTPEQDGPDPEKQYMSWVHVEVGDVTVIVGETGKVTVRVGPDMEFAVEVKCDTIDAPGHPGSTSDAPHPLQGVAHCNVTMPLFPAHRLGESGVWVDGPLAAKFPEQYVMPG